MGKKKLSEVELKIKNHQQPEVNPAFHKTVSYSQFSMWDSCPHKWYLTYVENKQPYQASIHTVFGTAMHEVLQSHLTVMFEESAAAADRVDIEDVSEAILKIYNTPKEQRKANALIGREFFINEAGLTHTNMCKTLVDGIESTFENWKPRQRFEVFKVK